MIKTFIMLSISTVTLSAVAQVPSRYPIPVKNFTSASELNANASRMKISVLADGQGDTALISGLVLCSRSTCYKPSTEQTVSIKNTANGSSSIVGDFLIPPDTIESIYFEDSKSSGAISGSIKLASPLKVEKGFYGAEMLVVLKKINARGRVEYRPASVATNLLREGATSVYYVPSKPLVYNLPYDAVLKIPANALPATQIFSVAVHDTGDRLPMVDIYPYVDLAQPAVLDRTPLQRPSESLAKVGVLRTPTVPRPGVLHTPASKVEGATSKSIRKTGVIKSSDTGASAAPLGQVTLMAGDDCFQMLARPENQQAIANATSANGVVNVNWCENISPFVHIAFINMNDSRVKYNIQFKLWSWEISNGMGPWLSLKRITDAPVYSIVGVNGFTWSGEEGTGEPQWGLARGFTRSAGSWLSTNSNQGGNLQPNGSAGSQHFVMTYGSNRADPIFFETQYVQAWPFGREVVSSTTSIAKGGVCSDAPTQSRWSAVGAAAGKMVMISSTSDGETSGSELCPLFKAFGVGNAMRLDGGPSAAIIIDGNIKNPLTGLYSFKYGSLRRIPYFLRASH